MREGVIIGLSLLASVFPLLTFAWLWQVKEWRIDRLREHLRGAGALRQLLGLIRPAAVAAVFVAAALSDLSFDALVFIALLALASLGALKALLRHQQCPAWTKKAMLIVFLTIVLDALALTVGASMGGLAITALLMPLLQPLALLMTWLFLKPLDLTLKQRIMRRAREIRERYPNLTVVGITGSVGKTTTKELLKHILSDRNPLSTPAYVNSEIGVSKWLLRELPKIPPENDTLAIIEMGAYSPGEIRVLCEITHPTIGIITFIGTQHVALFGSEERLCNAKAELLEALPNDGHAFLNGDSARCGNLKTRCPCPVTLIGTGGTADLEAFDIEETSDGIAFSVGRDRIRVPLHGTHNVTNVLLAIAVAEHLGTERRTITNRLSTFRPLSSTFAVRNDQGVTLLDDTHNASPESFRAGLAWARSNQGSPKVLLTPGLIELGSMEEEIHRELGRAAVGVCDRIIFIDDRMASAFEDGFGQKIELLKGDTVPVPQGALLLCIGRMRQETIQNLLP